MSADRPKSVTWKSKATWPVW